MEIIIMPEIVLICEDFAKKSIESSRSHWLKRGVVSESKMLSDIVTGKLGEFAAHKFLVYMDIMAESPDTEIYESKRKSFNSDLSFEGLNFHCKTQSLESQQKYGSSWILQYGGNGHGHTDKLFRAQSENDYLIPMTVNKSTVKIHGIISIPLLFANNMIKLPKCDWFKDTKRAIYLEDITKLTYDQRWSLNVK